MTFDRKTHKKFRTTNLQKNVTIKERVREERRDARGTGDRRVLSRFTIARLPFPRYKHISLEFRDIAELLTPRIQGDWSSNANGPPVFPQNCLPAT